MIIQLSSFLLGFVYELDVLLIGRHNMLVLIENNRTTLFRNNFDIQTLIDLLIQHFFDIYVRN